jgi:hypothetical protein
LIEPARLRPHSSMPPWRGEGMTGTRASGCPRPAVAGDGAATHPQQLTKGGPPTQTTAPYRLHPPSALTAPVSFASLRCGRLRLTPWRADGRPPTTAERLPTQTPTSQDPLTVPAPSGMTHRGTVLRLKTHDAPGRILRGCRACRIRAHPRAVLDSPMMYSRPAGRRGSRRAE